MASKRPCEQQPGVADQFANAIVRQVKAKRIVMTKGLVYGYIRLHTNLTPGGRRASPAPLVQVGELVQVWRSFSISFLHLLVQVGELVRQRAV